MLPASTKYLIDDVIGKARTDLLVPLLGAVVGATIVQAVTSFALTQLLSKAAQRLIAEMRRRVQAHIGRLPVAYYDVEQDGRARVADHDATWRACGTSSAPGWSSSLGGLLTSASRWS